MNSRPSWLSALRADPLPWLLEEDESCPGVRYFALTQLLGEMPGGKAVASARRAVMRSGPVPEILSRQRPDGGWSDTPYGQKYVGTFWSVISLWQAGADPSDGRVRHACEHVLERGRGPAGVFAVNARSMYVHCLSGNICAALSALGFAGDAELGEAVKGMARMVTGEGVLPKGSTTNGAQRPTRQLRYYSSSTPGPGFQCVANGGLPCGWGAGKVLLALAAVPEGSRTPVVTMALGQTVEFLLSRDPAIADYPTATNTSANWHKFGFPVFYVTDYLTVLEGLATAGSIRDPRADHAVEAVLAKQDTEGRWKREYAPRNPVGFDPGKIGAPNKWVTLRALRVVKAWASS